MKKLLSIILILLSCIGFSQNMVIPTIEWHGKTETENKYIDLLNLKDKSSLIIKIGYSTHLTNGINADLIIYQNDGKVKRYVVYEPSFIDTKAKIKIKRKRIKKSDYQYYWEYLNSSIADKKYKIEKSKLNITDKEGEEKGTLVSIIISHGVNYHFWIYQGKNYIAYRSESPKTYIESKYPGYEERQKLVDLMTGFEQLTEKY